MQWLTITYYDGISWFGDKSFWESVGLKKIKNFLPKIKSYQGHIDDVSSLHMMCHPSYLNFWPETAYQPRILIFHSILLLFEFSKGCSSSFLQKKRRICIKRLSSALFTTTATNLTSFPGFLRSSSFTI